MARPIKELETELMALPEPERARLAHELIASLDKHIEQDEAKVEAAWLEEVKRRDAEIERGEAKLISADEAMRRVRDTLKNKK